MAEMSEVKAWENETQPEEFTSFNLTKLITLYIISEMKKKNPTGRSMQIMLAYMKSPIATICGEILTRHSEKFSPVRKEYQELANLYKVGVRFAP